MKADTGKRRGVRRRRIGAATFCAAAFAVSWAAGAEVKAPKESWDWASAMLPVAKKFDGPEGVVVHIGDSITYANPNTQWARIGKGKTAEDEEILKWSHAYKEESDLNGWWLAVVDRPGYRSETAASGIRVDQYLKGGFRGMPSPDEILKKYKPQVAIIMLGTNDATARRKVEDVAKDMSELIDKLLDAGTIPVLSTLPPHRWRMELVRSYNDAYRKLAAEKKIPMIDLFAEMEARQPGPKVFGTLVASDGVHLTHEKAADEPTEENLSSCGCLLRCWLAVQKLKEVKKNVLDRRK
ncbi:MAG: SGNH/GDSL hydrolase family protein [Planctomycetota bacterium]|nr:SGNH/GDSL hydrolase family protein [Planctomycetota bacterium]